MEISKGFKPVVVEDGMRFFGSYIRRNIIIVIYVIGDENLNYGCGSWDWN